MNLIPFTPPSVRTIARQQGIDLAKLLEILSWRRPDESDEEKEFVERFLDPIPGMLSDDFSNRFLCIGTKPNVMWSCHTDTVSSEGGMQNIKWDGDMLRLNEPKTGQTLGADDGAGLWLMLEMIKAERPGLYIFHRAEEVGGLGSKDIAKNFPELVANIDMAIAFDRKATDSVITFQRGSRCCSDAFALELAKRLNVVDGLKYELDQGGVFTDTASYTQLIPECTNLSAGYYQEHTSNESLDVAHLLRLREALLQLNVSDMPIERDPTKVESRYPSYSSYQWGRSDGPLDLYDYVKKYPYGVSQWLERAGYTVDMLEKLTTPKSWSAFQDQDLAQPIELEDVLYCRDCGGYTTEHDTWKYGDSTSDCVWCRSNNVTVVEQMVDQDTGEVVDA